MSSPEYDTRLCAVVPATVGLVGSLGLAPPYFNGVWGDTDAMLSKDFSGVSPTRIEGCAHPLSWTSFAA
jgi:hypothetical protein